VKIQVEEDPTVESLFIIEEDKPLISRIIVKNQVICIEYTCIGQGIYNLIQSMLRAAVYVG